MTMHAGITMTDDTRLARGAGHTHPGNMRSSNQDVIVLQPDIGLYAVFDGMGGAAAGDIAARTGAEMLVNFIRWNINDGKPLSRRLLELAIRAAGIAVFDAGQEPLLGGMGTTVVACLIIDSSHVAIGHAGDSRAYRLHRGNLFQLTRDHTIVQELVEAGRLAPEDAERSPVRHVLTRNLGDKQFVKPDMLELDIEPGDRLLLCSDGLNNGISVEEIHRILETAGSPDCVAQRLVDRTLQGEARDNVSAIVIER